jgi:tetraacyldisaccharide 4'-kinase
MDSFRELVSGRRQGMTAAFMRSAMNVLEFPYFSAMTIRNFLYDFSVLPTYQLPIPILSVGNLTLGGTGKSPVSAWIGQYFLDQEICPGFISRGYGKSSEGINDEFLELAFQLPSVPHLQNRNRIAAAHSFLDLNRSNLVNQHVDVLILDDAFQHRRIGRNLDVVLLDASEPFGYEHVFPRGTLRESVTALRRADVVFLSHANLVSNAKREEIRNSVTTIAPDILWGEIVHEPQSLISVAKNKSELSEIRGKRVLAFCGIGNPNAFQQTLECCHVQTADLIAYPDHHRFTSENLDHLEKIVQKTNVEAVLCTMKDIVKIKRSHLARIPILAVLIKIRFLYGELDFKKRLKTLHEDFQIFRNK